MTVISHSDIIISNLLASNSMIAKHFSKKQRLASHNVTIRDYENHKQILISTINKENRPEVIIKVIYDDLLI
ncbi:hypothetical protein [Staphylococcus sp. NAM3COL9]|uniref:hypothetical protein n=1 Tax=Staphylococcus sp. NAM3COL9 TaxID=1667172 RepID=UPI0012E37242|nr:hypothetical protein [Staphylococcus sp. NAM3COL9]